MEEIEDPTERLRETMEAAEEKKERWTLLVALSTAVIAVLAAIAGLLGNHHANEAMLEQVKSSDQWAYYQSKSIKNEIAASTAQIMAALDKPRPAENAGKLEQYKKEKEEIKKKAEEIEKSSEEHMQTHVVFSRSVTIFQIAIAISAIAILTRKKIMWYMSLVLTAAGCWFFVLGFLSH
jgi:Domain of unknown function (DUF4337)